MALVKKVKRTDVNELLYGRGLFDSHKPRSRGSTHDRFLVPPFSILNTRDKFWIDRRRRWVRLGIQSEVGRKDKLTYKVPPKMSDGRRGATNPNGTSMFDPFLCEILYNWFCPPSGIVVDPFCGGSVRGIVASCIGLKYWGCDLRQEQIDSNYSQLTDRNTGQFKPKWVCGDSYEMLNNIPTEKADFIFSCPPYGCLEKYSDHKKDLSNMTWANFVQNYQRIAIRVMRTLKEDRFAVFVVANYREPGTHTMRDLVGATTSAFEFAGMPLYNEIILMNSVGTAAMRTNTSFVRGKRKILKVHQNILVFVKGDPLKASDAVGILPEEV